MEFDEKKFKILPREKDMYEYYRGKFAEIRAGESYCGVYRGMDINDELILFPFLGSETYEEDMGTKRGNGKKAPRHIFLIEEPAFIYSKSVTAVTPIREEYVIFWIEKDKPKIILP